MKSRKALEAYDKPAEFDTNIVVIGGGSAGLVTAYIAAAVKAMIDAWTPAVTTDATRPGRRPRQLNVLANASLTPGDLEVLKDLIASFDLHPVVIPDISESLDGHLNASEFTPLTSGGTSVSAFTHLGDAVATLVVGASMGPAADLLYQRTGVPDHRLDHLMGMQAMDRLVMTLAGISGKPVPARLQRQRSQLQDAMLDTHFMLSQSRVAVAAEADLLNGFSDLLAEMGAEVVAAVVPCRMPVLERIAVDQVKIGDLEDLEMMARLRQAEVIIGSSHGAESARRLGLPLVRAGFPLYDRLGEYQRTWIGYRGTRRALFDLANMLLGHSSHEIEPYFSLYSPKSDHRREATPHELTAASANSGWRGGYSDEYIGEGGLRHDG